ncbi:hypothetical protein [Thermomonospora curvata]|uniref:Uncharacterized protein n=1 Tax=Thermomonospora curvata (strain ATCC 19995 / DSM 43183 / JCM 3096 / KCTC 9072 / NBRC 15933 / NCIMB 10081 / Henssen B9) TaxID=471852 RepID=D1A7C8_THECD|nr:hypothetical protein [Thermomonospora curvata]ACZ00334.1 hypothetical protein Tcur_4816 [Thermomonospora curvata DSM 43183]
MQLLVGVVGMQDAFPRRRDAAAALVAWGNAWLGGHVGLDEAADAIEAAAGPQVVAELPGDPHDLPLRRALAALRVAGMSTLRLALPAPGDPLGLTGPPELNAAAVQAGEAVLVNLPETPIGLVPAEDRRGSSYVGVRWQAHRARPGVADVPSLSEADHGLTLAMREATETLLTVTGTGGVPPEIADALADLRDPERCATLAPGYPPRAHRVAALAGRLALVVDLARRLEGHGLTAAQMQRREEALRMLDRAVRRARVAAHNSAFDPVP